MQDDDDDSGELLVYEPVEVLLESEDVDELDIELENVVGLDKKNYTDW